MRNGYAYQLDPNAKVREVSGEVDMAKKPSRSRSAQARAGGADRRPTDDGGHYVGARFNGPTDAFNHFAQDAKVNRGRYRAMEDQWARAKAEGKRGWFRIVPVYEGESQRPSLINAWFTINDREHSIQIPNESGKKSDAKQ
ncbi:DNA/RNA non-specific endonuclease [Sphingomonas lycopersici]|uniref:DNA/RNA non-specific endonuclease n=1 Tax=Sphingomonas lycopersici TaxID=2951807 RepID=UPI003D794B96